MEKYSGFIVLWVVPPKLVIREELVEGLDDDPEPTTANKVLEGIKLGVDDGLLFLN